jgi:plastocyanin
MDASLGDTAWQQLHCAEAAPAHGYDTRRERIKGMKTIIAFLVALAFASGVTAVRGQEQKTTGGKAAEVWDKTKKTTKEVTRDVVDKTAKAVEKIESSVDRPDADANRVDVTITEKGVQMPKTLKPGKTAFVVKNGGKEKHNFEIEGPRLDKSFWFAVAPNATKTMQVNLEPGTYEADCKLHEGREPKVKLTVK